MTQGMRHDEPDSGRRRAGRPSTSVLTRDLILETAFELADERGGDFSVAAIARRLGVQPPAIYNYFASKTDIIAAMRGEMTSRLDTAPFELLAWDEAVLVWARQYLEAMGKHPGIIATFATLPIDSEMESMREYETIVGSFLRAGYPEDLIVPAIVAIEAFIIGSVLDSLTPEDNLSPTRQPELAPQLNRVESRAREAAVAAGTTPARRAFELGLKALVAGLRAVGEVEGR